MAGLTLDTGALIAAERGDRQFWAFWKEAVRRDADMTVPAGVLAQAWRGNHAVIARLLRACIIDPLDHDMAKQIGALLAQSRSADVVDASVVVGAARRGDAVLTTNPKDLVSLTAHVDSEVDVIPL